jgi:hypothetical protein
MGVTIDDARAIAATLPRSYEALVRDQVRFRVGRMVYAAFYHDDTIMGFGFPRDEREALVASEPDKFLMPRPSDMRYQWVCVRRSPGGRRATDGCPRTTRLDVAQQVPPEHRLGAYRTATPTSPRAAARRALPVDPERAARPLARSRGADQDSGEALRHGGMPTWRIHRRRHGPTWRGAASVVASGTAIGCAHVPRPGRAPGEPVA